MANRVHLGSLFGDQLLRVSKPGFNVQSSLLTPEQLVFDSRWSRLGRVWMKGVANIVSDGQATISYGRTFAVEPIVMFYTDYSNDATSESGSYVINMFNNAAATTKTALTLYGGGGPGTWSYYYFVFEV